MKRTALRATAAITLIFVLALFAGCADHSGSELPEEDWLLSAEPEYLSEWPDNEFTRLIPQPQHGEINYVVDYSDYGRYCIVVTGITEKESETYIEELKMFGYTELASEGNEVSVGTLLQKENVALSVSYSGDEMNVLITMDEAS